MSRKDEVQKIRANVQRCEAAGIKHQMWLRDKDAERLRRHFIVIKESITAFGWPVIPFKTKRGDKWLYTIEEKK